MWSSRAPVVVLLASLLLLHLEALVSADQSSTTNVWQTLKGKPPLVIAHGGFSGLFPGSSEVAYDFTLSTSVPDVLFWCDVQLTKEGAGICFPDLLLDNNSDVKSLYPKDIKHYTVNGVPTSGWFTIDYTLKELANVTVTQGVYSRADKFDGNGYPILTVETVALKWKPPGLWLNIENNIFFSQHNLSMRNFVHSLMRKVAVNYISSPEVAFLNSIKGAVDPRTTELVFRFLEQTEIEPSTNQTYGSLLNNLTFIKTFASGILVPKTYKWPVTNDNYLEPHTSLVLDAHKANLAVFASDMMNDATLPYNYSYDPLAEYLSFIDNGNFTVDGVLSDFPITASEAIDCFAHRRGNASVQDKPLVISKNGASGDYPDCTNLAYMKALEDGVDVLDCPVQMSKDGIPFCSSSINLIDTTRVVQSSFQKFTMVVPEIQAKSGIYTFTLTWDQIKFLQPSISNPQQKYQLYRNPRFRSAGTYMKLSEFLTLAMTRSSVSGVLIILEYAAYLAEKQGLSATDAIINELKKAGLDNQTALDIMIQSTNSSVLMKFKETTKCKLVYKVEEVIGDALNTTLQDIKKFANAVVINKASVLPLNVKYVSGETDVVTKLHAFDLPVYVELFSNEFVSQAWDFSSDPTVEINSFVSGANIDGIITDFPKTAARYKRNKCSFYKERPSYMLPIHPGSLLAGVPPSLMPPAEAPNPVLRECDVIEPPLPSALAPRITDGPVTVAAPPPNGQPKINAECFFLTNLALLVIIATLMML